jgi:hypothetical protein
MIDGPWRIMKPWREALLSFIFDGDDEPGDPSGLHIVVLGWSLGFYWPMHWGIEVSWSATEKLHGKRLRVARWTVDRRDVTEDE